MFTQAVDKYDSKIQEGKVYTLSNGQVKLANLRYTSVKNDYSLVFDVFSTIDKVEDDESI
jgi:ssDNA-binding replication factor A large subunit